MCFNIFLKTYRMPDDCCHEGIRIPEHDTEVRLLCGDVQLRRVLALREWRVEQVLGLDYPVQSIPTGTCSVCFFLG